MHTATLSSIHISPNRVRKKFTDRKLEELALSIDSKGLMHPPVLRPFSDVEYPQYNWELVAGERRLKAIQSLWAKGKCIRVGGEEFDPGIVPFTMFSELDVDMQLEAELEENICREDLTIQERAAGIKELHDLRIRQRGEYNASETQKQGVTVGHTISDTAREVHGDNVTTAELTDIRDALLIAQHLNDPEVAAAPDKATALKAIKETQKAQTRKARAELFDSQGGASTGKLFHADVFALRNSPDHPLWQQKYDVILTDPPYGISADRSKQADGQAHKYDDSPEYFAEYILGKFPQLCMDVTANQAHVYVFCDYIRFTELLVAFELAGFECWRRPLIWDKGNAGSFGNMEYGFRKTYDCILFANKNRRKMVQPGTEVLRHAQNPNGRHPAHKPTGLYVDLLRRSCMPGDKVFDPFCGSGPIFPAAGEAKVSPFGVEVNEEYYNMAIQWLQIQTGTLKFDDLL